MSIRRGGDKVNNVIYAISSTNLTTLQLLGSLAGEGTRFFEEHGATAQEIKALISGHVGGRGLRITTRAMMT